MELNAPLNQLFVARIYNPEERAIDPDSWYVVNMTSDGIQCVALDAYVAPKQQTVDTLQSIFQRLNERGQTSE